MPSMRKLRLRQKRRGFLPMRFPQFWEAVDRAWAKFASAETQGLIIQKALFATYKRNSEAQP